MKQVQRCTGRGLCLTCVELPALSSIGPLVNCSSEKILIKILFSAHRKPSNQDIDQIFSLISRYRNSRKE
jgi:hypothetical protein